MGIFREYIGSQEGSKHENFPSHIIHKEVNFHFIVAYSKESYENNEGSGNFDDSWDIHAFNKKNIEDLKNEHKNAKVIVSIGGPKDETRFNPTERNEWLFNAKESLKKIINDYKFDGIDINYETILSTTEDFNFCIGSLIKHLKAVNPHYIASIAPSKAVNPHYKSLFKAYKDNIDWVDYKFYEEDFVPDKKKYIELYNTLSDDYKDNKGKIFLLAGFSTNPNDAKNLSQGTFLDACKELNDTNLLPGIFVSDADYSKPGGYVVENLAQNIIAPINENA